MVTADQRVLAQTSVEDQPASVDGDARRRAAAWTCAAQSCRTSTRDSDWGPGTGVRGTCSSTGRVVRPVHSRPVPGGCQLGRRFGFQVGFGGQRLLPPHLARTPTLAAVLAVCLLALNDVLATRLVQRVVPNKEMVTVLRPGAEGWSRASQGSRR